MFQGQLVGIYLAPRKGQELHSVPEAVAVAGRGLEGDRYFAKEGTFSDRDGPDREVTLIENEALEALTRETGIPLKPEQSRRNLVTVGVPLNHLVGQSFQIGEVVLQGIRLCEPCGHLEALTCKGVREGLLHRGGLRAKIAEGGALCVGDVVAPHS